MNGNKALLDTNILIYILNGEIDFVKIAIRYPVIYISVISYMEFLGYNFANVEEERIAKELLNAFEIIQTDMEITENVIRYRKLKKIKIPDAIIIATAKKVQADIITSNTKDFAGLDANIKIVSPF